MIIFNIYPFEGCKYLNHGLLVIFNSNLYRLDSWLIVTQDICDFNVAENLGRRVDKLDEKVERFVVFIV